MERVTIMRRSKAITLQLDRIERDVERIMNVLRLDPNPVGQTILDDMHNATIRYITNGDRL